MISYKPSFPTIPLSIARWFLDLDGTTRTTLFWFQRFKQPKIGCLLRENRNSLCFISLFYMYIIFVVILISVTKIKIQKQIWLLTILYQKNFYVVLKRNNIPQKHLAPMSNSSIDDWYMYIPIQTNSELRVKGHSRSAWRKGRDVNVCFDIF